MAALTVPCTVSANPFMESLSQSKVLSSSALSGTPSIFVRISFAMEPSVVFDRSREGADREHHNQGGDEEEGDHS